MLEGEENYQFIRHVNCLDDCEELSDSSFLSFFIGLIFSVNAMKLE